MIEKIQQTLENRKHELLQKPNVVAVGIGYKESAGKKTSKLAIIFSVKQKVDKSLLSNEELIPQKINGVVTDVVQTGEIFASFQDPTRKHRPIFGGISVAHRNVTAGTIGHIVYKEGYPHVLSNNHVIANSNSASIGDAVVQPGPFDGGTLSDSIGYLSHFVPIKFIVDEDGSCGIASWFVKSVNWVLKLFKRQTRLTIHDTQPVANKVDCALARIVDTDFEQRLNGLGTVNGTAEPVLGERVRKTGRTTGITNGTVDQINVTVNVNFGGGRVAMFTDQFMSGNMSAGGDSGSLAINDRGEAIGLLFAGSPSTTIFNRYSNVKAALGL